MTPPARQHRLADFPFWLLAIVLLGVVTLWAILTNDNYATIFRLLLGGLVTTLWVTFVAFFLASVLGMLVALARTSRNPVLRQVATFYVELIRGVPILVFLFYVAFVGAPAVIAAANWLIQPLQAAGWMPTLTVRNFELVWRAVIALTICYSAFLAEIFRAGIEAVPAGQVEAARALGLRPRAVFRHVVFPQALRTVLPPLGNDFVSMIKDSALVSALGVQDITLLGNLHAATTFQFLQSWNVVAFMYLSLTITLSLGVRYVEKHLRPY
jgi:polar amino acid transport system permease protein